MPPTALGNAGPNATRRRRRRTSKKRSGSAKRPTRSGPPIATLEGLCADQPLREQARVSLAEALARAGRRADALRTLEDLRRRLIGELGLGPSAALGWLERAILDGAFDVGAPVEPVPARLITCPPAPPSPVFGRDADVAGAETLLGSARLVTVVGPGGVGKTTVALLVAARVTSRYRDGSAYVDLSGIEASVDVAAAIARALGVERQAADWTDRLVDALVGRELLLIVDNVAQVIDEASRVIHTLLRRASTVAALVTSREPLAIPGERLWPVEPLSVDDPDGPAVALSWTGRPRFGRAGRQPTTKRPRWSTFAIASTDFPSQSSWLPRSSASGRAMRSRLGWTVPSTCLTGPTGPTPGIGACVL